MENKGLEIIFRDGTKEYYDPVTDYFENGFGFDFYVGGYNYTFSGTEVESIRWYDLCDDCGHEIYEDGCRRCIMEKELIAIRDTVIINEDVRKYPLTPEECFKNCDSETALDILEKNGIDYRDFESDLN